MNQDIHKLFFCFLMGIFFWISLLLPHKSHATTCSLWENMCDSSGKLCQKLTGECDNCHGPYCKQICSHQVMVCAVATDHCGHAKQCQISGGDPGDCTPPNFDEIFFHYYI